MVVRLTKLAEKQYKRLNNPLLSRVAEAINKLGQEPPEGDIVPITGTQSFRARVGGLRVLFQVETDCILVTDIVSRGQAYDKKHTG